MQDREKLPVRLLKSTKVKDGKTYHNLHIQLGEGSPIAIDLVHYNFKVKGLLLANAIPFEVERKLKVSADGVLEKEKGESGQK